MTRRREKRMAGNARSEIPHAPASTASFRRWLTVLLLASCVATFVLARCFLRPGGMAVALLRPAQIEWRELEADYRRVLERHGLWNPHRAVHYLLGYLSQLTRGTPPPPTTAQELEAALNVDQGNWIARLAFAVILDIQANGPDPAPQTAPARYAVIKSIIENNQAAERATLYRNEMVHALQGVMRHYILNRPEQAVTQAADQYAVLMPFVAGYGVQHHYLALPAMQRRLTDLAAALRGAGQGGEANRSADWLGRALLGLMTADGDVGTRLLCADLLVRAPDAPADLRDRLAALRADYHARADAATRDRLADSSGRPAIAPDPYRMAFDLLLVSIGLTLCGCGAAIIFVTGLIASVVNAARADPQPVPPRRPLAGSVIGATALLALLCGGLIHRVHRHDLKLDNFFSNSWALLLAAGFTAVGGLIPLAVAARRQSAESERLPMRRHLPLLLLAAWCLLIALPAGWIDPAIRRLDHALGLANVLTVAVPLAWATALFSLRKPRMYASGFAGAVWLACLLCAAVMMPAHLHYDRQYQNAASKYGMDEVAARLGDDWRERYLQPALRLYDVRQP